MHPSVFFSDDGAGSNANMTIEANGNVGIGTDNPHGYKLAVNGYAIAEDFTVAEYNDWPDFVFTPKYHILSLNELDNFIQQYGHLPGIPTADDVKENGIKLGEINRKLLQKVEELTLYIIEQDKKIKAMEKEIQELK